MKKVKDEGGDVRLNQDRATLQCVVQNRKKVREVNFDYSLAVPSLQYHYTAALKE